MSATDSLPAREPDSYDNDVIMASPLMPPSSASLLGLGLPIDYYRSLSQDHEMLSPLPVNSNSPIQQHHEWTPGFRLPSYPYLGFVPQGTSLTSPKIRPKLPNKSRSHANCNPSRSSLRRWHPYPAPTRIRALRRMRRLRALHHDDNSVETPRQLLL